MFFIQKRTFNLGMAGWFAELYLSNVYSRDLFVPKTNRGRQSLYARM